MNKYEILMFNNGSYVTREIKSLHEKGIIYILSFLHLSTFFFFSFFSFHICHPTIFYINCPFVSLISMVEFDLQLTSIVKMLVVMTTYFPVLHITFTIEYSPSEVACRVPIFLIFSRWMTWITYYIELKFGWSIMTPSKIYRWSQKFQ